MQLQMTLESSELSEYLTRQINFSFPSSSPVKTVDVSRILKLTLGRVEFCFSNINNKYFSDGQTIFFNHLNGDQYSMFLYFACRDAFETLCDPEIASKIYLLNKSLHGIDAFYEVQLPDIFVFIHPIGTVLGRASYQDFLVVYQRCGIGTSNGSQPKLGKYLTLHPGSSVLGNSCTGTNCAIASDSLVIDQIINGGHTYIGNPKKNYLVPRDTVNEIWRK